MLEPLYDESDATHQKLGQDQDKWRALYEKLKQQHAEQCRHVLKQEQMVEKLSADFKKLFDASIGAHLGMRPPPRDETTAAAVPQELEETRHMLHADKKMTSPHCQVTLTEAERMAHANLEVLRERRDREWVAAVTKTQEEMRKVWWRRLFKREVTWEMAIAVADSCPSIGLSKLGWVDMRYHQRCALPQSVLRFVEAARSRPAGDAYRSAPDREMAITMTIDDYQVLAFRAGHGK